MPFPVRTRGPSLQMGGGKDIVSSRGVDAVVVDVVAVVCRSRTKEGRKEGRKE